MLPSKPNGALIKSVTVTSPSVGVYEITLVPHECGNNLPPLMAISSQIVTGGTVDVTVNQQASPPLTGTFDVTFNGHSKTGL